MTRSQALVLAGHGSQHHPGSAAPLYAHADRIRSTGAFDEVRVAFWKEEPALRDVRSIVESDVATVVPILTSEGYFADEVFPRELGVDEPARDGPEIVYAEPVGTHDGLFSVVERRVEAVVDGPAGDVGVAIVGHGTERNERSARATRRHAARLRERGRYSDVVALYLDEAPYVDDVFDHLDADELVVVPLFVADGYHTTRDVPAALGHPGIGETASIRGRIVHYTGAVGTEPSLADVIVERAGEAGARLDAESSTDGATPTSTEPFLRWFADATPPLQWGELWLSSVADATAYDLRNVSDRDVPRDVLDAVDGPGALRELVRYDDGGRYRPLTGAWTLPTGWVLPDLGRAELADALRVVYPGSIELWYRARTGDLDVTDFGETAARQTGIYADLVGLDRTELSATTEAVCGTCVRHRCWSAEDGDARTAPPDDGAIPCREACPFFLSAAHAVLTSGSEAAVRPDPSVPVGALEEPANEYRVQYARALARHGAADPVSFSVGVER